ATVGSVVLGPGVPFLIVLGTLGVLITLGSTWYGLIAVVATTMLLPEPFSVHAGPVTVTVGRLLLFSLAAGWFASLRLADHRLLPRRTPLDGPIVVILAAMVLSTIANLPRFAPGELLGALRKMSVFGIDFFLLYWITASVIRSEQMMMRLLRV